MKTKKKHIYLREDVVKSDKTGVKVVTLCGRLRRTEVAIPEALLVAKTCARCVRVHRLLYPRSPLPGPVGDPIVIIENSAVYQWPPQKIKRIPKDSA